MRITRVLVCGALVLVGACGSDQPTPAERLQLAIRATEGAETFTFTLDGAGQVTRGAERQDLNFVSTGEVRFPDQVHMTVNIDQPTGGLRSELMQIDGIAYIRPGTPGAKWQRSEGRVELAGFDPLASFDFAELRKTRVASDAGRDVLDTTPVRKIRLDAKEDFRKQAESRLPPGFEGTTLEITTDMWVAIATNRIARVIQRYDYKGRTTGYFETDLLLEEFGAKVTIATPTGDELSDTPLNLQSGATPAPVPATPTPTPPA